MKIVLIGFMCSGKSKVGKLLSQKLNWPLFDTDDVITKKEGASIADLIRRHGEPKFREIESAAVQSLESKSDCVVSTGGGVPLNPDNMRRLSSDAIVVWLKVSAETVLKRAGDIATRPLIDPANPLSSIRERLKQREPLYAVAPHHIDTDSKSVSQIADEIQNLVSTKRS